jgi:tetratricopeptide (TPR) repeat protein
LRLLGRCSAPRRLQEALVDFDQAVAMDASSALSYSSRALLLERLGRPDRALPDHDRALALEPANSAYLKHRGLCCRTLGQYAAAIADFTRWVSPGRAIPLG